MSYKGDRLAPLFDPEPAVRCARRLAQEGAVVGRRETRRLTPVGGPRPGSPVHLRDSFFLEAVARTVLLANPAFMASWATTVEHAPMIEHGWGLWGPHHAKYPIRPKKPDGFLRFIGRDGKEVFTKLVMHPGAPGRHMVADGGAAALATMPAWGAPILEAFVREQEAKGREQK